MRPARVADLDTIVAPATPLARSAIAVVRLSGSKALEIARMLAPAIGEAPPPRTAVLADLRADGKVFDQGLVTFFPGPASYTGEDVVEISLHGNPVLVRRLLSAAEAAGARAAAAGEFTRRAFVAGKLSLAQAEAVAELVEARSEAEARGALGRLAERSPRALAGIRDALVTAHALWTAAIDFPEQAGEEDPEAIAPHLESAREALDRLAGGADVAARIRSGIRVVVSGPPNAGKSTIFNGLVGYERAIVSPAPGTTRDTLESDLEIAGLPVRLVDTAGLRDSADALESTGIKRSRSELAGADLVVWVHDASLPWSGAEPEEWASIASPRRILVFNKSDLAPVREDVGAIALCALSPDAPATLAAEIARRLVEDFPPEAAGAAVSRRQRDLLFRAARAVRSAQDALARGERAEIAVLSVEEALGALSDLAGETTTEDVLDRIFAAFCIGK